MTLRDRIERRQPNEKITPLIERRGGSERRVPTWLRRKNEQGLPAKDYTMKVAA